MIESLHDRFFLMEQGIKGVRTTDKIGTVKRVTGLIIESEGPKLQLGKFVPSLRSVIKKAYRPSRRFSGKYCSFNGS